MRRPWDDAGDPELDARLAHHRAVLEARLVLAKQDLAATAARKAREQDAFWNDYERQALARRLRRVSRA